MAVAAETARLIRSSIGALCEVMTEENRLLFVGRLQRFAQVTGEICVVAQGGMEMPLGIIYRTEVKIRIHTRADQQVVLAKGALTRGSRNFWWIEVLEVATLPERRENFRVKTKARGLVTREDGRQIPCSIVDISLTGLCLSSAEPFQVGEMLTVSGIQLREEGDVYSLSCRVRRTAADPERPEGKNIAGCSFEGLRGAVEAHLCKDIFALQAKAIRRK